jgi:hypothetical protein
MASGGVEVIGRGRENRRQDLVPPPPLPSLPLIDTHVANRARAVAVEVAVRVLAAVRAARHALEVVVAQRAEEGRVAAARERGRERRGGGEGRVRGRAPTSALAHAPCRTRRASAVHARATGPSGGRRPARRFLHRPPVPSMRTGAQIAASVAVRGPGRAGRAGGGPEGTRPPRASAARPRPPPPPRAGAARRTHLCL